MVRRVGLGHHATQVFTQILDHGLGDVHHLQTVGQRSRCARAGDLDDAAIRLHHLDRATTTRVAVVDGGLVVRVPIAGNRVAITGSVEAIRSQALLVGRVGYTVDGGAVVINVEFVDSNAIDLDVGTAGGVPGPVARSGIIQVVETSCGTVRLADPELLPP